MLDRLDLGEEVRKVIRECFGDRYDPSRRYLICIQGATSSGKSVFSETLHRLFSMKGIESHVMGLDAYYNTPDNPLSEEDEYDFDNPASLNWDNIFSVMEAFRDGLKTIPHYKRPRNHGEAVVVTEVPNPMPRVLIVEGVYAFNTVDSRVFNIGEYDPYDSRREIQQEFASREPGTGDFRILKILMTQCRSKLYQIRLKRDLLVGKPRQAVVNRFNKMIFPATLRWVYSDVYSGYIKIVHGNFNRKKIKLMTDELSQYFFGQEAGIEGEYKEDLSREFSVECSGECNVDGHARLVLGD
jgi:uridine kinase